MNPAVELVPPDHTVAKQAFVALLPFHSKIEAQFYRGLIEKVPEVSSVLPKSKERRHAKFVNMMSMIGNIKHFNQKQNAYRAMLQRHDQYGVDRKWYSIALKTLWQSIFKVSKHTMRHQELSIVKDTLLLWGRLIISLYEEPNNLDSVTERSAINNEYTSLIDLINSEQGESIIMAVHQVLYDHLFDDEWLGQFFYGKNKSTLIRKQTQFMLDCFRLDRDYTGETPGIIHMHMFITDEQFERRHKILKWSMQENHLDKNIVTQWLEFDRSFRQSVVKNYESDCILKCPGQMIVTAKKPTTILKSYD